MISEETRRKLSEAHKGKTHSDETKKKMSIARKGRVIPEETRAKMRASVNPKSLENLRAGVSKGNIPWNKGLAGWNKGHVVTEETRRKISRNHNPKSNANFSLRFSEKGITNLRLAKTGNKNPAWNGGSSFEPYDVNWTESLRKQIRHRDKFRCRVCNKLKARAVHHIDYNKKNSQPENLVTLCGSCHQKTNHKREHWMNFFKAGEMDD